MYGLEKALIEQIVDTIRAFGAERVVLFGSRARGDYRQTSDIDLAVYGLSGSVLPLLCAMEDLPTLLRFDVVSVCPQTDRALLTEIEKDGVELWKAE